MIHLLAFPSIFFFFSSSIILDNRKQLPKNVIQPQILCSMLQSSLNYAKHLEGKAIKSLTVSLKGYTNVNRRSKSYWVYNVFITY